MALRLLALSIGYLLAMPLARAAVGLTTCVISFGYLILVLNPLQVASLLVRPFSKSSFRAVNRWCARSIWGWWAWMAERQNGIDLRFFGDPVPVDENAVILPNHQTMADVMVLLCYGRRARRIGDLKWFVKDPVKWVPGPGWGMKLLDCIYVKRDWARDQEEIHRLFDKFVEERIPISLVTFLEGTRFTPKKHTAAVEFAEERGLPVPRNTLVPRTKGFVATMEGLRSHLAAVHDVTIVYPHGVPTLLDCFTGKLRRVDIHVRRHPVGTLPDGEEALASWVRDVFVQKDQLIDEHRRLGAFPS